MVIRRQLGSSRWARTAVSTLAGGRCVNLLRPSSTTRAARRDRRVCGLPAKVPTTMMIALLVLTLQALPLGSGAPDPPPPPLTKGLQYGWVASLGTGVMKDIKCQPTRQLYSQREHNAWLARCPQSPLRADCD
jgi:hypothetical protein